MALLEKENRLSAHFACFHRHHDCLIPQGVTKTFSYTKLNQLVECGEVTIIRKITVLNLPLLFSFQSIETFPKPEVILIRGEVQNPLVPIKMAFK